MRIYGQKREILSQQAEEVRQALSGIAGIVDLHIEGQVEEPTLQVKVNLDAAGRASVKPGDVRRASATVFGGLTVGFLFKEQKIYEVVVYGCTGEPPEHDQSCRSVDRKIGSALRPFGRCRRREHGVYPDGHQARKHCALRRRRGQRSRA